MITTLALTTTPNHKCFMTRRIRDSIPSNSENKPQGLHFSKALFEGLIFGGAYLRREICVSKAIGLAL